MFFYFCYTVMLTSTTDNSEEWGGGLPLPPGFKAEFMAHSPVLRRVLQTRCQEALQAVLTDNLPRPGRQMRLSAGDRVFGLGRGFTFCVACKSHKHFPHKYLRSDV